MNTPVGMSVIVALMVAVAVQASGRKLTTKPDFLTQCTLTDPGFNRCFMNNFQGLLSEWKDGIPGLKSVGGLDPLYVKRVTIDHDQNPVSINANLQNLEVRGLGDVRVEDGSFDVEKLIARTTLVVPKINLNSDYSVKGRILSLALNGNGKAFIHAEHLEINLVLRLKLRDDGDLTFTDLDKLHLDIKEVGGFRIRLDNLFHGQKVLEESANAVFNENWHEFYEILRPAIKSAIETIMSDRLTKIFAYVPATFLVADLPTAAEYYG